jgi:hypothetical protein
MPVADAHIDAANDALAGSFPAGSTVHLYTGVDDPTVGPDPADELATDGGYVAASLPVFDASVDGNAHADVDFGTSTDAWSDVATAWAIRDSGGVLLWWDILGEVVDVTAAGTPVVAGLDLYPALA